MRIKALPKKTQDPMEKVYVNVSGEVKMTIGNPNAPGIDTWRLRGFGKVSKNGR